MQLWHVFTCKRPGWILYWTHQSCCDFGDVFLLRWGRLNCFACWACVRALDKWYPSPCLPFSPCSPCHWSTRSFTKIIFLVNLQVSPLWRVLPGWSRKLSDGFFWITVAVLRARSGGDFCSLCLEKNRFISCHGKNTDIFALHKETRKETRWNG